MPVVFFGVYIAAAEDKKILLCRCFGTRQFLLVLLRPCLKWKDLWSASLFLCFGFQLFLIVRATSLTKIRGISRENNQTTRLKQAETELSGFFTYPSDRWFNSVSRWCQWVYTLRHMSRREKPIDIGRSSVISFVKISFTELDELQKIARIFTVSRIINRWPTM